MFLLCIFFLMNLLQIFNQIIDLRYIQEFSDNVRRLNKTKSKNILFDGSRVVILGVK